MMVLLSSRIVMLNVVQWKNTISDCIRKATTISILIHTIFNNSILYVGCTSEVTIDYSSSLLLKHNQLRSQLALGLSDFDLPIATNTEYLL